MKYLRWICAGLITVFFSVVIFLVGKVFVSNVEVEMKRRHDQYQARHAERLKALRTLRDLELKYGDTPVEQWAAADKVRYYGAQNTLKDIVDPAFTDEVA